MRRLQRIGSSTLVSLPKEWVVSNNLEKGSEVQLEFNSDTLMVTAAPSRRRTKSLVIAYPLPPDDNITANLTGAYLLGYDIIRITSRSAIPAEDRENIRDSSRRLAGLEIIEEGPAEITMQFLLDPTALDPHRILSRMNAISLGMFGEVLKGMQTGELSALGTLQNRDAEVNRQYFLLVRLIRSSLADGGLGGDFDLKMDMLDYRIAANLLENAGDAIVGLGEALSDPDLSGERLLGMYGAVRGLERPATKAVDALIRHDRRLAIEAISFHNAYQSGLARLRREMSGDTPIRYIDLVYGFERLGRLWSDVADLVRPTYQ